MAFALVGLSALPFGFAGPGPLHAQIVSRSITVNGDMADWTASPDLTTRIPTQASEDCQGASLPTCDLDGVIQSTGRDLRLFAFTYDASNVYFYVGRWASTTNTTEWLFYLDEDADGLMETGERIFRVDWQGSNRQTNAYLCPYFAANPGGDPLTGDGTSQPGSSRNSDCRQIYSGVVAGSADGLAMESALAWSQIGASGPKNVRFHISSSVGMNLPTQIRDNMGGPGGNGGGGGQLFPPDMQVELSTTATQTGAKRPLSLTVALENIYFDPFTSVMVDVTLPAGLVYVSHTAAAGTSFVDTGTDGVPDRWQVPSLPRDTSLVLQIDVEGGFVDTTTVAPVRAALVSWGGTDSDSTNNADGLTVTVAPYPVLEITKSASVSTALPGDLVIYTAYIENTREALAYDVRVVLDIAPEVALRLDSYGAGVPFRLQQGAQASGLTLGTVEYSDDGGATWGYTPTSGGGGALPGYDAEVTHVRIPLQGAMNNFGAAFQVEYQAVIR